VQARPVRHHDACRRGATVGAHKASRRPIIICDFRPSAQTGAQMNWRRPLAAKRALSKLQPPTSNLPRLPIGAPPKPNGGQPDGGTKRGRPTARQLHLTRWPIVNWFAWAALFPFGVPLRATAKATPERHTRNDHHFGRLLGKRGKIYEWIK